MISGNSVQVKWKYLKVALQFGRRGAERGRRTFIYLTPSGGGCVYKELSRKSSFELVALLVIYYCPIYFYRIVFIPCALRNSLGKTLASLLLVTIVFAF